MLMIEGGTMIESWLFTLLWGISYWRPKRLWSCHLLPQLCVFVMDFWSGSLFILRIKGLWSKYPFLCLFLGWQSLFRVLKLYGIYYLSVVCTLCTSWSIFTSWWGFGCRLIHGQKIIKLCYDFSRSQLSLRVSIWTKCLILLWLFLFELNAWILDILAKILF